jgi:hypothetical protein
MIILGWVAMLIDQPVRELAERAGFRFRPADRVLVDAVIIMAIIALAYVFLMRYRVKGSS